MKILALGAVLLVSAGTHSSRAQEPPSSQSSEPDRPRSRPAGPGRVDADLQFPGVSDLRTRRGAGAEGDREGPGLLLTGGPYEAERRRMVEQQIAQRGIDQKSLLAAMAVVPRHLFVAPEFGHQAYHPRALPIGWGQFISQPYLSARMIEVLELGPGDRVLEIGTGSGYDAALLSHIASEVYTIEIVEKLGAQARENLRKLGYENVHLRIGDGYQGWPEEAPFDAILLTAAPPRIPRPLLEQLKVGGRLVLPLGQFLQDLLVMTKTPDGFEQRKIEPVRLAPMSGEVQDEIP